jgi:hypothetical protein
MHPGGRNSARNNGRGGNQVCVIHIMASSHTLDLESVPQPYAGLRTIGEIDSSSLERSLDFVDVALFETLPFYLKRQDRPTVHP